MSNEPHIADRTPIRVAVKEGRTYFWCACGLSARQPFCDGSHKDTDFAPLEWKAVADQEVFFCRCKQTAGAPLCDGSHNRL